MSYKYNNGEGAIVCNACLKTIETGMTPPENNYHLCDSCQEFYKPEGHNVQYVDNFDVILNDIVKFETTKPLGKPFYFIQIIQRKKDGNDTGRGNNGARTIKTYYAFDVDFFREKKHKIVELCRANNARAYIHVNRRNSNDVMLEMLNSIAKSLKDNITHQGVRMWDHCCGVTRDHEYNSQWIIDVDNKDRQYIDAVIDIIKSCRGSDGDRIITEIPTANGVHIISYGFDTNQFAQKIAIQNMDKIDILKDGPTLLYFEKKLMA